MKSVAINKEYQHLYTPRIRNKTFLVVNDQSNAPKHHISVYDPDPNKNGAYICIEKNML